MRRRCGRAWWSATAAAWSPPSTCPRLRTSQRAMPLAPSTRRAQIAMASLPVALAAGAARATPMLFKSPAASSSCPVRAGSAHACLHAGRGLQRQHCSRGPTSPRPILMPKTLDPKPVPRQVVRSWVTPRRAARGAAQPPALDEAVAWLARAAPVPPELVAALAGKHLKG